MFVEASVKHEFNIKEAAFVQQLAHAHWRTAHSRSAPRIKGIVAFAPLELGKEVKPVLRELKAAAPLLTGIRRSLDDAEVEPCWFMKNESFVEGLRALAEENLHFELYTWQAGLRRAHYACVPDLLALVPELRVILINAADMLLDEPDAYEEWRAYVTTMASRPNTFVKIGGSTDPQDLLAPYYSHVFNSFGYERALFAGNWFAVGSKTEYTQMTDALLNILKLHGANRRDIRTFFCSTMPTKHRPEHSAAPTELSIQV